MFSGLHMETKKKIARILKASGLQNWMDDVAVCWDREQSRSARLGQSVDKDAYFQQGAKDANRPCGLWASGHWMQSTQRSSGPETVSGTHLWPRSVSATLLPPFPDCVRVLSSENRFYYFLFVCFPLADISHVQCPALGSASGMLEWAVTETVMIQHHLGEGKGVSDPVGMWQLHQSGCALRVRGSCLNLMKHRHLIPWGWLYRPPPPVPEARENLKPQVYPSFKKMYINHQTVPLPSRMKCTDFDLLTVLSRNMCLHQQLQLVNSQQPWYFSSGMSTQHDCLLHPPLVLLTCSTCPQMTMEILCCW